MLSECADTTGAIAARVFMVVGVNVAVFLVCAEKMRVGKVAALR